MKAARTATRPAAASGGASRAWSARRTAWPRRSTSAGSDQEGRARLAGRRAVRRPQGRIRRAEQAAVRRLRRRGHRRPAGQAADQGVLRQELAQPHRGLPDRRHAAGAADRHEADRPLPGAGEVRPQGPQGRGAPVGADGALHPHDHPRRPRPGREGRPAAAQPGRRGHAADRPRGEGTGDDLLVLSPARRVPGLVRAARPGSRPVARARLHGHAPWRGPVAALAGHRPGRGYGADPPVGGHGPLRRRGARR